MMAVVRIAFAVLALATSASAECAWVLWQNYPALQGQPYHAVDSYSSEAACKAAVRKEAATEKALWESRSPVRGTWRCLPDTIDPRGPKGK